MTEFTQKALLIVNPVAGRKTVLRYLAQIIRVFMEAGYLVTGMVTSRRGEATELARRYGGDFDLVVCAGGDGTLHETLSGLAAGEVHVPLGYIPCGTTNDFANSHGLSTDILTAARQIADGRTVPYDIGRFGEEYFSYVALFGAFSWMAYTTDQTRKNRIGYTAYVLDGVRDLSRIRPTHLRLNLDGVLHEGDYIFGSVSNTPSVAGIIELPKTLVDPRDGKFEVLLIQAPKTLLEWDAIVHSILVHDFSCPLIELAQARDIQIDNPPELEWSLDGENAHLPGSVHITPVPEFMLLRS